MSKHRQGPASGRRAFLKGVAVAGGAAAAATATVVAPLEAQASAVTEQAGGKSRGYHVTDHVREYYAKARV